MEASMTAALQLQLGLRAEDKNHSMHQIHLSSKRLAVADPLVEDVAIPGRNWNV
jgi:hypothetical protein